MSRKLTACLFTVSAALCLNLAVAQPAPTEWQAADLGLLRIATNAPETGAYYSWQNPHWPPSPKSLFWNSDLKTYQLEDNRFLIDDRLVHYGATVDPQSLRTMSALSSDSDSPGDAGQESPSSANSFPDGSLWLSIHSATNGQVSTVLHGTQSGLVYKLCSKTNLFDADWTIEASMHAATNQDFTTATVQVSSRTNLFLWAMVWSGIDDNTNSIEDWWEWENFGDFNQPVNGDFDGDGVTNIGEYLTGTDPNTIDFWIGITNRYLASNVALLSSQVRHGVPASVAFLVDSTNIAAAAWLAYNSNLVVDLGTNEGWHQIAIGVRGRLPTSEPTWRWTRLKLDRTPPALVLTNLVPGVALKPLVQLQGYSPEPLASIYYDISNALGSASNVRAFIKGQAISSDRYEFGTNYFQCFDLQLTNGPNTVTVHAIDLAGNASVTNVIFTIQPPDTTNPPSLTLDWPSDQMHISGSAFTARGRVDDPSAMVSASIVGSNGATAFVMGVVDRYGRFWIDGLPLSATKHLTVTATDIWSNSVTTNLDVFGSPIAFIMDTPGDLYKSSTSVQGTIGNTNYGVWVNGQPARVVDPFGSWIATNVPVNAGSTATFELLASSDGTNSPPDPLDPATVNASTDVDKPQRGWIDSYDRETVFHSHSESWDPPPTFSADVVTRESALYNDGEAPHGTYSQIVSDATGTYTNAGDMQGDDPQWWQDDMYERSLQCGSGNTYLTEFQQTIAMTGRLFTGGKALPNGTALFHARGYAVYGTNVDIEDRAWSRRHAIPAEKETIGVFGGPDTNFEKWLMLPEGETFDLTPLAAGETGLYGMFPQVAKYKPRILIGTANAWIDCTGSNIPVVVGENIGLAWDMPPLFDASQGATDFHWSIPGYAIASWTPTATSATLDTNINLANSTNPISFCWVDGGTKHVEINFTFAGQKLSAATTFKVVRPEVTWTLTAKHHVAVETNNCDTDGFAAYYHLQTGKKCSTNDVGMYFAFQATDMKGYSGSYEFQFVQIATIDWKANLDLHTPGTNWSKYREGRGLDGGYPYQGVAWNGASGKATDTPWHVLADPVVVLWRRDSFESYLMFKPSGGTAVPLKRATWNWYGCAQRQTTNSPPRFAAVFPFTNPQSAVGADCLDPPQWTNSAANLPWNFQTFWYAPP